MHNLDDPSQTSFYVPYQPQVNDEACDQLERAYIATYKLSWAKCSAQLHSEIDELYKPTADAIVNWISTVHEDVLPGLPYPELPLIAVHNSSSLFIDALIPLLSTGNVTATVSALYPSDAPNTSIALRSLISKFLDTSAVQKPKLASYDISLLDAYFTSADLLLIVLHSFEQFEPSVMQDVFHICSTRIPSLRLTFLAFLSSPSTPSYIHTVYPRSTLTHLRVHSLSVQGGTSVLEGLLLKTFFNPRFEPDLVLGPSAMEGAIDYYTRHNNSIDALMTCIQLVHLKHFLNEPLSILIHPPSTLTIDPIYAPVLSLLQSRIPSASSEILFDTFQQHSVTFRGAFRALRLGFTMLHKMSSFLVSNGYKIPHSGSHATINLMISTLRGQTAREIKILAMYAKKLRPNTLHALLTELHDIYLDEHDPAKDKIRLFLTRTRLERDENQDELGTEVSMWLSTHLISLLKPLTQHPLWDIYYTGSSPFPSDLLNPSPRATLISALIRPHSFTAPLPFPAILSSPNPHERECSTRLPVSLTVSEIEARLESTHIPKNHARQDNEVTMPKELHKFPDTSILFWRYLDSGKLINIYDWYESFKVCLDAQRAGRTLRKGISRGGKKSQSSRKKSTSKIKGKGRAKAENEEQEEQEEGLDLSVELDEPDEDSWQREVQARFIRALHELDYLGFIKHTNRKSEHVMRVVFDVGNSNDGEEEGEEREQ